ncbi:MAG: copper chaperone PCu(A)C [Leptospiraceae bacterium]|nr:copper chaperone PCu(A)C [Leptospiraceae bacterium]MDW8307367.1 copper chaperone PCu(A)C [Leptospiraceae bacterium]
MAKRYLWILLFFALCQKEEIGLKDPYVHLPPTGSQLTAAFLTIQNKSRENLILEKAYAEIAELTELHETYLEENMARMRAIPNLVISPSGELQLKPGSYHIMLINLKRELKAGEKIPIELYFNRGKRVVLFEVKEASAMMHAQP